MRRDEYVISRNNEAIVSCKLLLHFNMHMAFCLAGTLLKSIKLNYEKCLRPFKPNGEAFDSLFKHDNICMKDVQPMNYLLRKTNHKTDLSRQRDWVRIILLCFDFFSV